MTTGYMYVIYYPTATLKESVKFVLLIGYATVEL